MSAKGNSAWPWYPRSEWTLCALGLKSTGGGPAPATLEKSMLTPTGLGGPTEGGDAGRRLLNFTVLIRCAAHPQSACSPSGTAQQGRNERRRSEEQRPTWASPALRLLRPYFKSRPSSNSDPARHGLCLRITAELVELSPSAHSSTVKTRTTRGAAHTGIWGLFEAHRDTHQSATENDLLGQKSSEYLGNVSLYRPTLGKAKGSTTWECVFVHFSQQVTSEL